MPCSMKPPKSETNEESECNKKGKVQVGIKVYK